MEISSRRFQIPRRTADPNALAKFGDPGSIGRASFWRSKFRAFAALRDIGIPVPGERASSLYCLHTTEQSHTLSIADDRRQPSECSLAMPISLGNLRRTHANSVHNGALWETSNPRNSGSLEPIPFKFSHYVQTERHCKMPKLGTNYPQGFRGFPQTSNNFLKL
jgi:hypothetical protein